MIAAQQESKIAFIMAAVAAAVALIILLLIAAVFASLFLPWIRSLLGGAPVSVVQLLGMRVRGVPPGLIIDALIALVHRGHAHDPRRCYLAESIYLAQRGLIQTSHQLADRVEKQLPSER